MLANKIDLGDDDFQEAISLKPFSLGDSKVNPLKFYELFATQKLAFDMGRPVLARFVHPLRETIGEV